MDASSRRRTASGLPDRTAAHWRKFEIEEVQMKSCSPHPVLSETQAAWPVYQPLISSTYRSSGHSQMALSDCQPKPPKKRSTTRSRRPKKVAAAFPEPPMDPAPKPEPSSKEDGRLIDFWAEPAAPGFHEPAPRGWGTHGQGFGLAMAC
ncbi:hypothetical protein DPX16_2100 [Anabarilius grahami]|uniref:Uncharacterized protein n=1 Tax=Anabarilius grahami TaxID=495550 RepID=A0A3N0Y169_ANAGA|nr:hypothetical protein DPX16_2100 [Anabarilius grahami]